ncbi:hypothetical protein SprV_0200829000 [Sparganum proliferum]
MVQDHVVFVSCRQGQPLCSRTGCDAFFKIQYHKEGYLAVTSSNAIHEHEPAPAAPRPSKQKSLADGCRLLGIASSPADNKGSDAQTMRLI